MNWLKEWMNHFRETPKWITIATAVILAVSVYFGIVIKCIGFMKGNTNGTSDIPYHTVYPLSSVPSNTAQTSMIYIIGIVLCLLLGLICLLWGIARSIHKLDGKANYLFAAFLVLFSINTFTAIDFVEVPIQPVTLFVIYRITYFIYSFPIFLFVYHILHPLFYKWVWPLLFIPATYSIAAWVAYLTIGLPLRTHEQFYTTLVISCFVVLLAVGLFGTVQKTMLRYVKIISAIWVVAVGYVVTRILMGHQLRFHEEAIIYYVISAAVTVCYLVLSGTKEIFTYKTDAQMMETKNNLLLESYKNIETYMNQIALMKHEMKNQLFAIKILLDNNDYDRLASHLEDIQDSYSYVVEPVFCGHRLIQSILNHANQRANQSNIKIDFDVDVLQPVSITDSDTVSFFMNLLNNAFESCENVETPDQRWIRVSIKCKAPYLIVSVVNSMNHEIKRENGVFSSTKKDPTFHGHGISIVQSIVKKYDGISSFDNTDDSFTAKTALRVISG